MVHRIDLCRGWELCWSHDQPEPALLPGARLNLPVTIDAILHVAETASIRQDAPVEDTQRPAPALRSFKLVRRFGRPPRDAPASRMELCLVVGDVAVEAWLCTGSAKHLPRRPEDHTPETLLTWDVTAALAPRNALWVAFTAQHLPHARDRRKTTVLQHCELRIYA